MYKLKYEVLRLVLMKTKVLWSVTACPLISSYYVHFVQVIFTKLCIHL